MFSKFWTTVIFNYQLLIYDINYFIEIQTSKMIMQSYVVIGSTDLPLLIELSFFLWPLQIPRNGSEQKMEQKELEMDTIAANHFFLASLSKFKI